MELWKHAIWCTIIDMVEREEAVRALEAIGTEDASKASAPVDDNLLQLERLIGSGKWSEALDVLSEPRRAGTLSARDRLLWAIAQKEDAHGQSTSEAHRVGIEAMSELLGVRPDSPLALIVAKRALRTVAGAWRSRPAPKPLYSFLIIMMGLVFGGCIGYLVYLIQN